MRMQRGEPDFEHVVRAAPCVQHDAPPALAMRVDEVADLGGNTRLRKRLNDKVTFPRAIMIPA